MTMPRFAAAAAIAACLLAAGPAAAQVYQLTPGDSAAAAEVTFSAEVIEGALQVHAANATGIRQYCRIAAQVTGRRGASPATYTFNCAAAVEPGEQLAICRKEPVPVSDPVAGAVAADCRPATAEELKTRNQ